MKNLDADDSLVRAIFAERGLTASMSGMAAVLSAQAVQSAPVGLAASVVAAASAARAALSATSILHIVMSSTKAKLALANVLAASFATPVVLGDLPHTILVQAELPPRG